MLLAVVAQIMSLLKQNSLETRALAAGRVVAVAAKTSQRAVQKKLLGRHFGMVHWSICC